MISVVYCTREENPEHKEHIIKTSGNSKKIEVIEIINNGESLTKSYNRGLKEATNDIVVFCHDDIIFEKNGWATKLVNHFQNSNYGIIGIAGTTDLDETGRWWNDRNKMIGSVKHTQNGKTWENKYSNSYPKQIIEALVVDGLFFAVHKDRIKKDFDESVEGFHFYEIDFCFRNHLEDVKIGITFDVKVIHKSVGETNEQWEENRKLFIEKYKDNLPTKIKGEIYYDDKSVKNKNNPKISVIIPTKGSINMLTECVDSLWEKDTYPNMTIYIADTGSTPEEKEDIRSLITRHSIQSDRPRNMQLIEYDYYNFAKINNDVVNNWVSDDTELLLFCNNDIKLINNAISRMVKTYNDNKHRVGTIGARLHFGDNSIQHSGIITFLGQNNNKSYFVGLSHHGIKSNYTYHTSQKEVFGNTAAFLMIRKDLFNKLNGFNENYIECYEDVHLNVDCLRFGKKNIFVGDAVCYHYESQTRNQNTLKEQMGVEDYQKRIIPHIVNNDATYDYFVNAKRNIIQQIFNNAKTTH
jgi:GT2 family glycosyltransferase